MKPKQIRIKNNKNKKNKHYFFGQHNLFLEFPYSFVNNIFILEGEIY